MQKLVAAVILLFPTMLFAQSPFDGTWKTNLDASKPSPEAIVFSVNNGMYDCASCVPTVRVKADGSDQEVAGLPHTSIAVKEIDSHTIGIVFKRGGKVISEQIRTASEDERTLHVKVTVYPLQDNRPVIEESTAERIGNLTPGANTTSGSWRTLKLSGSDNGLLATYKQSDGELSKSAPTGSSWTARFDGEYYAVKGNYEADSVSLKKINDRTIELNFKLGGKIVRVSTITISSDGGTMTTVSESKLSGRVSTWVAKKQ
jgi:hypothetical protein